MSQPTEGGDGPVVWVTGQDLFFDSIVLTDLPQQGPFQLLVMGGPFGLMTEFGPGRARRHPLSWQESQLDRQPMR